MIGQMKTLFYKLPHNIATCFTGKYLIAQLVAIGLSIVIVSTDLDWTYYQASRDEVIRTLAFPAIIFGGILPILLPLIILLWGLKKNKIALVNAGWGLGQAALMGSFISSTYKAFTGRIPPHFVNATIHTTDITHGFQFGFMRGGIFWGWPSSHTTIAFAMAAAFAVLFPKHRTLIYLMFCYAGYVGLGVSVSIHWLSEGVAGAIMGTTIGIVAGLSFSNRYKEISEVTLS